MSRSCGFRRNKRDMHNTSYTRRAQRNACDEAHNTRSSSMNLHSGRHICYLVFLEEHRLFIYRIISCALIPLIIRYPEPEMNPDIWINGEFVPWDRATVHPLCHSLQRGACLSKASIATKRPTAARRFSASVSTWNGSINRPRSSACRFLSTGRHSNAIIDTWAERSQELRDPPSGLLGRSQDGLMPAIPLSPYSSGSEFPSVRGPLRMAVRNPARTMTPACR